MNKSLKRILTDWLFLVMVIPVGAATVVFQMNGSTGATSTGGGIAEDATVVIRGSFNGWAGTDWAMTNVGGDYWTYTSDTLSAGDYEFKFVLVESTGDVWEGTDNRKVTISGDTTLAVGYFNAAGPPYTATDSVDVWFRVSTAGIADYAGETMHLAGSFNGWTSTNNPLTQEGDGQFWSTHVTLADTGATAIEYKFLKGADGWESIDNRKATVSNDTTLHFVYLDNVAPSDIPIWTRVVAFQVDMTEWLDEENATGMPLFSVSRGDEVHVRGGFNGWNSDDESVSVMTRAPGTNIFALAVPITDYINKKQEYKYVMIHSDSSKKFLENKYGELYSDMEWEDSPRFGGSNRYFWLSSAGSSETLQLDLQGYYDLPAGAVVPAGQSIDLSFRVDMTGAEGFTTGDSVFVVLKDKWLNYTQGFGNESKHLATYVDGKYEVTITLDGPAPWHIIYAWEFKNSTLGSVQEGGGFGFGRFRARYFHKDESLNCAWPSAYSFSTDAWQKDPPLTLEKWDPDNICTAAVGIADAGDFLPDQFYLSDNYPNPFNPVTQISFNLPVATEFTLNVYNLLGEKVASLHNGYANAGHYTAGWNGSNMEGAQLPSGVYMYELNVGEKFRQVKKMMLLK